MTSPALGIAYVFWLRLRWVFAAALLLVPVFAIVIRWFPATAPYCQFASVILFFSAILPLLNACTFGPADLGARTSGFPTHMFVLPLSNRSLVGWPMLYAAIIFGGLWTIVAVLVFIPTDLPLPVTWPALMLVAICVWAQAIGWSPFPSPFIRVPALVVAVAPLILLPLWSRVGMPPASGMVPLLMAWSLAWSLAAFLFGVRGLTRARSGSEGDWYRRVTDYLATILQRRSAAGRCGRNPFSSAAAAQFWHECRRNALVMPLMLGFVGVPFLFVMCHSVIGRRDHSGVAFGSVTISPAILSLSICVGLPVLISVVGGSGMAKFDVWGKDQMPSFFAIRPMTTFQFIRIKLAAVALSTLAVWAIMTGMVMVWAALGPARSIRGNRSFAPHSLAPPRAVAVFFAVLLGLALLMWRNLVVGMWPTMFGRKWVSVFVGVTRTILFGGAVMAGIWLYKHPDVQRHLPAILPWIIGGLLAAKLFGAVAVGFALREWDSIPANRLRALYVGWLFLAGMLLSLIYCFTSPTWALAAGVILAVPFSRLAVTPLAMHMNRHR